MCAAHMIAKVLLVVGGLNWGLVGVGGFMGSDWNVVHMLLGAWPMVEWVVYILVGVSALMMCCVSKCCGKCAAGSCKAGECKAGSCSAGK